MQLLTQQFMTSRADWRFHGDHKKEASLIILERDDVTEVARIKTRNFCGDDCHETRQDDPCYTFKNPSGGERLFVRPDRDSRVCGESTLKFHSVCAVYKYWQEQIGLAERNLGARDTDIVWMKPFLYEVIGEPRYVINTFGFDNGTAIFVDTSYNPNIVPERYFRATKFRECLAAARKIAEGRRDKDGVSVLGRIAVRLSSVFTVEPGKEHKTDDFTRTTTGITATMGKDLGAFALMAAAFKSSGR